jgi:hypothetical protein
VAGASTPLSTPITHGAMWQLCAAVGVFHFDNRFELDWWRVPSLRPGLDLPSGADNVSYGVYYDIEDDVVYFLREPSDPDTDSVSEHEIERELSPEEDREGRKLRGMNGRRRGHASLPIESDVRGITEAAGGSTADPAARTLGPIPNRRAGSSNGSCPHCGGEQFWHHFGDSLARCADCGAEIDVDDLRSRR